jgi:hypothetical protein
MDRFVIDPISLLLAINLVLAAILVYFNHQHFDWARQLRSRLGKTLKRMMRGASWE